MKLQPKELAFYVLLPFAVFVLSFSFIKLQYIIKKPFLLKKNIQAKDIPINDFISPDQESQSLKTKDTDKDGLSDYDELYTYKTSPYLEDSDSDKINDKDEVIKGSDPNCPKNKTCAEVTLPKKNKNTNLLPFPNQSSSDIIPEINPLIQQNLSIQEIRELLKQVGVDSKILDEVDDETLLEIYKETIEKTDTSVN